MRISEPVAGYCRRCGYTLAGLARPRCPECGRPFDPADRRTVDRSPRRRRWRRAARVAVVLTAVAAVVSSPLVWVYVGWRREQSAARAMGDALERQGSKRIGPAWAATLLGNRAYWLDRRTVVCVSARRGSPAWRMLGRFAWAEWVVVGGRNRTEPLPDDDDLRGLADLHRVTDLAINESDCSARTMAAIGQMPDLTHLTFKYLPRLAPGDPERANLPAKTRLSDVCLDELPIGDPILYRLADCTSLTKLELDDSPVTDDSLAAVGRSRRLQVLTISTCPVGDRGVRATYAAGTLTTLAVTGAPVTDAVLIGIDRCQHLSQLRIEAAGVTGATLDQLHGLTALRELDLSGCGLTDVGLAHLPPLPKLGLAWFGGSFTAAGLKPLARSPALQHVQLDSPNVDLRVAKTVISDPANRR